jgi:hypothetical protein
MLGLNYVNNNTLGGLWHYGLAGYDLLESQAALDQYLNSVGSTEETIYHIPCPQTHLAFAIWAWLPCILDFLNQVTKLISKFSGSKLQLWVNIERCFILVFARYIPQRSPRYPELP